MSPVERYLSELHHIRATGAALGETSYYGPFAALVNELGDRVEPKVRCVVHLADRGAGVPDGGLFTADQFQRIQDRAPLEGQQPARGAIELKAPAEDVLDTAAGDQVARYVRHYGVVLVSNYRQFAVVARGHDGRPAVLERYCLAEDEAAFWGLCARPEAAAKVHGERLAEYLKRAVMHAAPIGAPEDVAWFLASYARDAKARVEHAELPALTAVRAALEEGLGLRFVGEKGDHFFRSTLVQTLFYGVFAAWVLWSERRSRGPFDWKQAAWSLHVPMIRALFEQVAAPTKLEPLGLVEPLEWAAAMLERVDRDAFFARFDEGHAVQYFYEPFLEHFDRELRKDLGVWYTPPEIVEYMVARVDAVLREELGIADGLADRRVYVLDPCCGTGAYIVEVLRRVHKTLRAREGDTLAAQELRRAAMERVYGFEIMPAPFVVAHLQLGMFLGRAGAPLDHEANQRAAVYLTNALTGWDPPKGPKQHLLFPEMEEERDAAQEIKRDKPILVILGNPPYNAYAGVSPDEENGLVEPYKEKLNEKPEKGGWGIKKFNLDDLYVRFFRLAERRIAERTGKGIVCLITNHSWISEPSFVVMRKHLMDSFDKVWIENLHGNRKISEYAPDGRTSETVFAIAGFSPGIQQGVATSLFVKRSPSKPPAVVLFRDNIDAARAADRRRQLLNTLRSKNFDRGYKRARPTRDNRYSFRPQYVSKQYRSWPKITAFSRVPPFNGPVERRGMALIEFAESRAALKRIAVYLDKSREDVEVARIAPKLMRSSGEFRARETRARLKEHLEYDERFAALYPFKVFDVRVAYLDPRIQPLFSRPSPELLAHRGCAGNRYLITRDTADKSPEGAPFYFSSLVCDYDCISGHARHFPVWTFSKENGAHKAQSEFVFGGGAGNGWTPNLSEAAGQYLHGLGLRDLEDPETAELLWLHALAIGHAPSYLAENAEALRADWPRIPLPKTLKRLRASAALGARVADLLDMARPVPGVTQGAMHRGLAVMGVLAHTAKPPIDLRVTAGWGHAGRSGVTMPGKGRIETRAWSPEERAAMKASLKELGLTEKQAMACLGDAMVDVYANETALWRGVPLRAWEYVLGGYQVGKKWLSYREYDLLGRALTEDEAREFMHIVRRIAALLLMQPALDANCAAVAESVYDWPG